MIKLGNLDFTSIKQGSTAIASVYLADEMIWSAGGYSSQYLTLDIVSGGTLMWRAFSSADAKSISYSLDDGDTWTQITSDVGVSAPTLSVSAGDRVMLKGTNASYGTPTAGSQMAFTYSTFNGSTASFNLEGNIMSLVYGDNFSGQTTLESAYTFGMMFFSTSVLSAEHLVMPATSLSEGCYWSMFNGCTSLATAPVLPASTLEDYCYSNMFYGCSSLGYIKCMATDISATDCTAWWVDGVAPYGTFYQNDTVDAGWTKGKDGIPNGWTPIPDYVDYSKEYLTFVAEDDNVSFTLYGGTAGNTFQYSVDNGSTWSNVSIGQTTSAINNGEKMLFKASGLTINSELGIGTIRPSSSASVEGNIMSVAYGDDFSGQTSISANFQFRKLFSGATNITSAENFVLPATAVTKQCYSQMFDHCNGLVTPPQKIGDSAMTFNGDYCFSDMFSNCTSMTTAPELPATTLGLQCYWYMMQGCTSLTTSPTLPAATVPKQAYSGMFNGCSNLNSITCLATSLGSNATQNWVSNVASSGTFTKNSSMSRWPSGVNGIPSNWTVVDAV